jgi:hypothetical protein
MSIDTVRAAAFKAKLAKMSWQLAKLQHKVLEKRLITVTKKLNGNKTLERHKVLHLSEMVHKARYELVVTRHQLVVEELLDELELALLKL